jgi:hypothetical protein
MLPPVTVPAGLVEVLQMARAGFGAPSFVTFTALVTGYLGATGRRTITGMWIAAGLAGRVHHSRAHRFFSHVKWCPDTVGLLLARAVIAVFIPDGQPVSVVVDDTLFHRYGRKVFAAFWQHDGSARGRDGIGRGNCFVIFGISCPVAVVGRPVFFPLLFRLYQPKRSPSKPELARQMAAIFARATCPRPVHVVADAAYRSKLWRALPGGWSFTTRLAHNATLYAPAPPPTGRRGRPATKGNKLGKPADLAAAATWRRATVSYYGKTSTVELATVRCLWYGSLGKVPVNVVLVRQLGSARAYDIALVTTDPAASAAQIVARYAARWPVEQSIKDGKDLLGAGDAQNRLPVAVARTVPFAMLCQTILILWYHRAGTAEADIAAHRARRPWYTTKRHASLDDMLIAFRRARITIVSAGHEPASQNLAEPVTCTAAAA